MYHKYVDPNRVQRYRETIANHGINILAQAVEEFLLDVAHNTDEKGRKIAHDVLLNQRIHVIWLPHPLQDVFAVANYEILWDKA